MIRHLTLGDVMHLHRSMVERFGGVHGVRDLGALESALAQPRMTFDGEDLYPTLIEKAAALEFSRIQNHPFVDGNKRVGHAAMETLLMLNGFEIEAAVDEQENVILTTASGVLGREELTEWLRHRVVERRA